MGMFSKRTTSTGALAAAIGSAVFSVMFKLFWPALPFMDRIGLVFLLCIALATLMSYRGIKDETNSSVNLDEITFATHRSFNISAIIIVILLVILYSTWW
ncbi:hypothetical protein [Paraglaciecola sp. 20A4]|uniref:hypothetical protein n=1 Tax=Paraglaciecola sp. 20A4 TaxID=2687288 RepID=UPI00198201A7|nr:hypothetical protein [Paraglaciecola sp. 20A4]